MHSVFKGVKTKKKLNKLKLQKCKSTCSSQLRVKINKKPTITKNNNNNCVIKPAK